MIATTRSSIPPNYNNGNDVGDTQREDAGDLSVAFNYGARFYELSVVESKNSTRSRREPGGRRRGPIKISSGEVWPNSTSPVVVSSMRSVLLPRARPHPHIRFFFQSTRRLFRVNYPTLLRNRKEIRRMTSRLGRWADNTETPVPSFKESVRFIPERIKRINTDALYPLRLNPFRS